MVGHAWRRRTAKTVLVAFGASCLACGESPTEPAGPTSSTVVSTTLAPGTTISFEDVPDALSDGELRKLVAPVALYPDVVLASLLPATTYPEQIHDAALWVDQQGGVVEAVPEDRGWDGSVAGLLQFPDVLRWADQNEPWTQEMGHAMTYQQGYVLRAIQDYRADVAEAGNLESNEFQVVERDGDDIRIQPAQPETVYVPQYDPVAATQPQPEGQGINPWIAFGGGVAVGALGAWALYSIFDDDDDDDDDDHHHRRRRRIRRVDNNYYYANRQRRPAAEVWTPRPRPSTRRTRRPEAFEPKPLVTADSAARPAKRARGQGGVRPPAVRPASGTVAAPDAAKPKAKQKAGAKKQGAGVKKAKAGGAKKKTDDQPEGNKKKGGKKKKKQE